MWAKVWVFYSVFSTGRNGTESEDTDFSQCGVNYCPATTPKDDTPKPENKTETDNFTITIQQRYILAGVYLICSVLSAIIVSIFVDPLSRYHNLFWKEDYFLSNYISSF